GLARARLQSHARHEYHRNKASPRGNPRMRASVAPPNLDSADDPQRPGDVLGSVRSICVSGFLAYCAPPNVFARPGSKAEELRTSKTSPLRHPEADVERTFCVGCFGPEANIARARLDTSDTAQSSERSTEYPRQRRPRIHVLELCPNQQVHPDPEPNQ